MDEQTARARLTTTLDKARARELINLVSSPGLFDLIATEREQGRAFGVVAELARDELAKRTGSARV
jgi:hypothetical protein